MKKLRLKLAGLSLALSLSFTTLVVPVTAHHCFGQLDDANSSGAVAECLDAGACLDTTGAECARQSTSEDRVNGIIRLALNILSAIVGVIAVIMIIVGGLKYVTSAGDANNTSSAKNTILYAVVGLVIVALAQIIVRYVLSKATGVGS